MVCLNLKLNFTIISDIFDNLKYYFIAYLDRPCRCNVLAVEDNVLWPKCVQTILEAISIAQFQENEHGLEGLVEGSWNCQRGLRLGVVCQQIHGQFRLILGALKFVNDVDGLNWNWK